jgi:hypothetical protein
VGMQCNEITVRQKLYGLDAGPMFSYLLLFKKAGENAHSSQAAAL